MEDLYNFWIINSGGKNYPTLCQKIYFEIWEDELAFEGHTPPKGIYLWLMFIYYGGCSIKNISEV